MRSLPEFIEAGMAFFEGSTVPASKLSEANELLKTANARIAELEKVDAKALTDRVSELEKENAAHLQTISTLETNFQTASRQAQEQITKAGASAPVVTDVKPSGAAPTFSDRVAAKVIAGKGKATAIAECIKEFPNDYAEWRKGNTSKI